MTSGYVMALIRSVLLDSTKIAYEQYRLSSSETTSNTQGNYVRARLSEMYTGIRFFGQSLMTKQSNKLDKMVVIKEGDDLFTDIVVPSEAPQTTPKTETTDSDNDPIEQGFELTGPIDLSKNETAKKIIEAAQTSDDGTLRVSAGAQVTFSDLTKSEIYLRTKGTSYANVEMITIFFDSPTFSQIGVEQGKVNAKEIMDSSLERLKKGEITMASLGQELSESLAVQKIDPGYALNTYIAYDYLKPSDTFVDDPEIKALPWNLPVGTYSDVLTGKSYTDKEKKSSYEAFYAIVHVTERQIMDADSLDTLLEQ